MGMRASRKGVRALPGSGFPNRGFTGSSGGQVVADTTRAGSKGARYTSDSGENTVRI